MDKYFVQAFNKIKDCGNYQFYVYTYNKDRIPELLDENEYEDLEITEIFGPIKPVEKESVDCIKEPE